MARWCSLFLPCADPSYPALIAARLRDGITRRGYTLYDPFALMPGMAYARAVKWLVSAARDGWVRVFAAPETDSLAGSRHIAAALADDPFALCLVLAVDEETAIIDACAQGERADVVGALSPFLRADKTPDDLHAALTARDVAAGVPAGLDVRALLPDSLQGQLDAVQSQQAQRLTERLSQNLLGKLGASAAGAHDLVRAAAVWDGAAGQRVAAFASCLTLPDDWRTLDYATAREAYALYKRRERSPNLRLLPGDQSVIDAVPDIAGYYAVYAGKNDP